MLVHHVLIGSFVLLVLDELDEGFLQCDVVLLAVVHVGRESKPVAAVEMHQTGHRLVNENEGDYSCLIL